MTANLAARMEQLATPGTILVTAYTHRLTEGYFAFKSLGQTQIKGVEAPLDVYEVLGAGPLRTKLQVAARRGLTRFVGRQREIDQLQRALEQAKAGHGQIVGVMGEPGLGKSRLFYEFTPLSQSGCLVLEAYSVSHGKAAPYLPLIELLKTYFRIEPQDEERQRRAKVMGQVLVLDRSLEETCPYLFALLGTEEQPSPLQQMDPQIRRRRTFEALKRLFFRESLNQPLILIFEDLHWIDSETQGFLDVLSESVASAKVLLLVNYRPEYRHEWGQKTYYTQLRLAPLGKTEAEEFLDVLLGTTVGTRHALPLRRFILEKTEGTPFFMEEVVQELFEQGVLVRDGGEARHGASLPTDLHLPTTAHGVLAARIDRLAPDEKALLQQLAVIGCEFPLSLLRQVIAQPEDELYRLLASLQRKEFLYEQLAFPEVEYIFKQALTRSHEVLHLAQELGHLLSLVRTLTFAALFHPERGEGHIAQEYADALVALASEHRFPLYLALGAMQRGAALIVQERWAEGVAQIRQGLEAYAGEIVRTVYLAWLARGYGGAGQVDEGLAAVAEALRLVDKNDERFYEAEVYRVKGKLVLQSEVRGPESENPNPQPLAPSTQAEAEAEACFLKASDIARQQQAKSLELRAVMSLVRLRQRQAMQQGSRTTHHETRAKLDVARNMLSEIYHWFSEGFDTKDLQEAKMLIEELAEEGRDENE